MSRINSRDRNFHIVALTASILLGLTVGAAAGHNVSGNDRDHRGEVAKRSVFRGIKAKPVDPATSIIHDHRNSTLAGGTGKPAGGKQK